MRKAVLSGFLPLIFWCICSDVYSLGQKQLREKGVIIHLLEDTFDFGDVMEGSVVSHTFVFKNTGKKPLVIYEVNASCGCTTPTWSKEPVAPGETGELKVDFDSKFKNGPFSKFVQLRSNAHNAPSTFVVIQGNVVSGR